MAGLTPNRLATDLDHILTCTERLWGRLGLVGRLLGYLWRERLWWLIPMVVVLLLIGLLILFSQSAAVAPFIYTLF